MVAKAKKRPAVVKAAFERFIELLGTIDGVEYVVMPDGGPPEVFTYVANRTEDLSYRVIDVENTVLREFPEAEIEFHIRFFPGHTVERLMKEPGMHFNPLTDA